MKLAGQKVQAGAGVVETMEDRTSSQSLAVEPGSIVIFSTQPLPVLQLSAFLWSHCITLFAALPRGHKVLLWTVSNLWLLFACCSCLLRCKGSTLTFLKCATVICVLAFQAYKALIKSPVLSLQHLPKVETIRAVAAVVGFEEEVVLGVVGEQLTQRGSSRLGM